MRGMRLSEIVVLLAAGTLGGIFSTVVAIASLVSYPVLLALGLPPLTANMTNTVSLVLTGAGSVAGSRPELAGEKSRVLKLGVITAAGGLCGAIILLLAPASTFTVMVPILIGGASIVLFLQPRLRNLGPSQSRPLLKKTALFAVALYVGYFGAAAGVLLLIVLSTMIAEPLIKVNAIKNAVSGLANLMAAVCFTVFGSVHWSFVPALAAGFLLGGWLGPKIARRVPAEALRLVVSLCGLGLAIRLGISAYR
jgi:uncharacterized membrane protein YfcA